MGNNHSKSKNQKNIIEQSPKTIIGYACLVKNKGSNENLRTLLTLKSNIQMDSIVQIPRSMCPIIKYAHCLMENQSSNGNISTLLALKARSTTTNITNRNALIASSNFDIAIVNDIEPTLSVIDGNLTMKYLRLSRYASHCRLILSHNFSINIIETKQKFSHYVSQRYYNVCDGIEYYIISIEFVPFPVTVDVFWILIVQSIKSLSDNMSVLNNSTDTRLDPIADSLPMDIINNIDEFAVEIPTNKKWYIINYNNNPYCLKKYADKCLTTFDI